METKRELRELTDAELIEMGENLGHGESWEDVTVYDVYDMVCDLIRDSCDDIDWKFGKKDAERMIDLMQEEEEADKQWRATHLKSQGGDL